MKLLLITFLVLLTSAADAQFVAGQVACTQLFCTKSGYCEWVNVDCSAVCNPPAKLQHRR